MNRSMAEALWKIVQDPTAAEIDDVNVCRSSPATMIAACVSPPATMIAFGRPHNMVNGPLHP